MSGIWTVMSGTWAVRSGIQVENISDVRQMDILNCPCFVHQLLMPEYGHFSLFIYWTSKVDFKNMDSFYCPCSGRIFAFPARFVCFALLCSRGHYKSSDLTHQLLNLMVAFPSFFLFSFPLLSSQYN